MKKNILFIILIIFGIYFCNEATEAILSQLKKVMVVPAGGTFNNPVIVALSNEDTDSSIIYTLDGSDPGNGNGHAYGGPITISSTSTLKAKAKKNGYTDSTTASYDFVINLSDADAVTADKDTLGITYVSGDSESNVTQDIILVTSGPNGTTISWSSDSLSIISNVGSVTRPLYNTGNATVTLTATISKGSSSTTKTFILTVIQNDSSTIGTPKIIFRSNRDGNWNIYAMNLDGTAQTRLTSDTGSDTWPSISSDGSTIAFESGRDGGGEVFLMNSDGSNQHNITNSPPINEYHPSISPNGNKVVFETNETGDWEIFIMNIDGLARFNLTNMVGTHETNAVFSYNGLMVAFNSNCDVYKINTNGTGKTKLTASSSPCNDNPAFSPDGSKVIYDSLGNFYTVNIDGTNTTQLTFGGYDYHPSYSPDGSKIVFYSARDGNHEIYIMDANGSNQTRLTNSSFADNMPVIGF